MALRVFAQAIRLARRLGLQARWTLPTPANRRILASGLFDADAYLQAYPHAGFGPLSPLDHFMAHGARAGCDPNPCFSVAWYLANNPDVARAGANPLLHYIEAGEREGRAPSREFDPAYYAARYPDAAAAGEGLLAHFLARGRVEGRSPKRPGPTDGGAPYAWAADVATVKRPRVAPGDAVALVACHAPAGRLRPHALAGVEALRDAGRKVVVIAAVDAPFDADVGVLDRVAGLYVREDIGRAFAAWAHALQVEPGLYAARSLLLVDDSMASPLDPAPIAQWLQAMEAAPGDVVGLTDSYEGEWRVESHLMLIKASALRAAPFQRFMLAVRSLSPDAPDAETGEHRFAIAMRAAGVATEVLFPVLDGDGPPLGGRRPRFGRGSAVVAGAPFPLLADNAAQAAKEQSAGEALKVDYLGPWNFAGELGEASRDTVSALWRTPFRLNIQPVRPPFCTHGRIAPTVGMTDLCEPADVAIVHLDADGLAPMSADQQQLFARAQVKIGLWDCETEPPPAGRLGLLGEVDAVWVPSRRCADLVDAVLNGRPIDLIPRAQTDEAALTRVALAMQQSLARLTARQP